MTAPKLAAPDAAPGGASTTDTQASGNRPLRAAMVYSLPLALQRAINFILLPLYTRAIAPAEYGALGVLLALFTFSSLIFSLGLEIAIVRSYFERADEPGRLSTYLDSVWRFLVVYPIAAALVLSAAAWPFVAGGDLVGGPEVLMTLLAAAFQVAGCTLPLAVMRARHDLRRFVAIAGVSTFTMPSLSALFVIVLDMGLRGYLLSMLLGAIAAFVAAIVVFPWHRGGRFEAGVVRGAVSFSLPFLPHTASQWALNLADRSVLAGLVTTSALGRYSLAANISAPLLMLMMSLTQAFMPMYARAGTRSGHEQELRDTVVLQITSVVILTLACAVLGGPVADIMTPESYDGASELVPWIALGFGFFGLYGVPMNGATLGAGRSKRVWIASASAAATNLALLFLFVPDHGILAAAVASAVGYAVLLVAAAIWAHSRPNPVTYDWRRITPVVVGGLATFAAAALTAPGADVTALIVRSLWLVAFVVALMAGGILPRPRRRRR